jgi:DNA-binding NarL/FixJ family response regulator
MITVAVVDDQELTRDGFTLILDAQPDITVVGSAEDGRAAVELVRATQPDVVLMDVRMPVLDGIRATEEIVRLGLSTRVLVLTTYDLDEHVYEALRAGASGFLLKDVPRAVLVAAVRRVREQELVLTPEVTRRIVTNFVRSVPFPDDSVLVRLSPREQEVLRLVAEGHTNAEIAERLFLSHATVKTHVARVLVKLGLRDRVHVVIWAYEHGVVRPGR